MKDQIEKQAIEEMAAVIASAIEFDELDFGMAEKTEIIAKKAAEKFYAQGYRKQNEGEWVKVYQNKVATVYECSRCKHLTFGTSDYCICGAHMKGGAE